MYRSAITKKYYEDPYSLEMEHKKTHKNFLPLINLGTWSRVYAVSSKVTNILRSLKENNPEIRANIISIGCGFDTFYFLLKEKFDNFKYYEFDYEDITYQKIEKIKNSNLMKSKLGEVTIKSGSLFAHEYSLIACDVTDYDKFNDIICKIPDIDLSLPTIVISECLLVYIKKETTMHMLTNLSKNFKNLIFLEYDLIGPNDSFGKEMVENLLYRDIKLFGYEDVPDIKAQAERLYKAGFTNVEVYDMLTFFNNFIDQSEKERVRHLEMLDEFEEFNMLQNHACFGYGAKLEEKYEYLYDEIQIKKN